MDVLMHQPEWEVRRVISTEDKGCLIVNHSRANHRRLNQFDHLLGLDSQLSRQRETFREALINHRDLKVHAYLRGLAFPGVAHVNDGLPHRLKQRLHGLDGHGWAAHDEYKLAVFRTNL